MEFMLIVLAVIGFFVFKALAKSKPKTYPILKPDMFQPADLKITTNEAKRLFKKYMKDIGYLDDDELSEHAGYLADAIRSNEEDLRSDMNAAKETIKDSTIRISALKKELATCVDEARREEIADEIEDEESAIESDTQDLEESKQALDAFKADKREFLIEYINQQTQSRD